MNDSISKASINYVNKYGWNNVHEDLIKMIDSTLKNYKSDDKKVYLSGLSFGGYGTWQTASKYPDKFAAINPVVGYGFPELMKPIADKKIPIWAIAGGRDKAVPAEYFYVGLNTLKEMNHHNVRFTMHQDSDHVETWRRVYGGQDIYDWLLSHSK
jgi:predicted peptidase